MHEGTKERRKEGRKDAIMSGIYDDAGGESREGNDRDRDREDAAVHSDGRRKRKVGGVESPHRRESITFSPLDLRYRRRAGGAAGGAEIPSSQL